MACATVAARWRNLKLATQYMIIAALTVIGAMLVLGQWVAAQIEKGVIRNAAATAALYTDSLIEANVQELAIGSLLSPESQSQLDRMLLPEFSGKAIIAFKIWQGDTIVHSSRRDLVGKSFPPAKARLRALAGEVTATFDEIDDGADNIVERQVGRPVLEIYAPIREAGSGRIIALAETYEVAATLHRDLFHAVIASWVVVAAVTASMIMLQLLIVMRGSRTIDAQRRDLNDRIEALTAALAENAELRSRSHNANQRMTEINERFLRDLGANLHDGPVQLLSLTQLRLGTLRKIVSSADPEIVRDAEEDLMAIREAVADSLEEIRNVAVGLVPPEIEKLGLGAALEMAARRHQKRTRTDVACDIGELPENIPAVLRNCLYRFAQEGLNNAFRHAGGLGQRLTAHAGDRRIEVCVMDSGPGIDAARAYEGIGGQGLMLLRDRIEALGGTLEICNQQDGGACLAAIFDLPTEDVPNV